MQVTVTGAQALDEPLPGVDFIQVDFAEREAVDATVRLIAQDDYDVLVNNAGINRIQPFFEVDPSEFDRILDVNLRAAFRLCQAVLPGMRRIGSGRIVNISSVFAVVSKAQRAAYSTSKFGLTGLTKALAAEVAAENILVNCVAPGFIDTDLTRRILGEAGIQELVAQIPLKRLGRSDEVAALVSWLVSEQNTYVSAQVLVIDGGFTSV